MQPLIFWMDSKLVCIDSPVVCNDNILVFDLREHITNISFHKNVHKKQCQNCCSFSTNVLCS